MQIEEKSSRITNLNEKKRGLRSLSIKIIGDFLYHENLNCHMYKNNEISANIVGSINDTKKKAKIPDLMKSFVSPEKPRIKKKSQNNTRKLIQTKFDNMIRN